MTNTMVYAQIERGSIVSSLGGSFMYKEGKLKNDQESSLANTTRYKETNTNWKITGQGRYFINQHWQTGIYLSYGMSRYKENYSYGNAKQIYQQSSGNSIFNEIKQHTSTYKAGPSFGFLSGSKFRTSLFCNLVPYVTYYKSTTYYENNLGESNQSAEGISYGILLQPSIWYSLSKRFILEFNPIELNLERPGDKRATRDLSFKASFQAISFTINYQVK